MPALVTLTKRADFLAAAKAQRKSMPGFTLQARQRGVLEVENAVRIGFTCSKKVGNAVARNRAKRRLRAIAREVLPGAAEAGWDYVLIGRPGHTAALPYLKLKSDLEAAVASVHGARRT